MAKNTIPAQPERNESIVFILQRPRPRKSDGWTPDLSSAEKYGRLEFVFDVDDRIYANPDGAMLKARQKLDGFNADRDFLLWPGFCDPMALATVLQVLIGGGNRLLRYLYWARSRTSEPGKEGGYYFPVEVNDRQDRIKIN